MSKLSKCAKRWALQSQRRKNNKAKWLEKRQLQTAKQRELGLLQ
nr:hypothetical protein [uncultured Flavobacterium sp.]